MVRAFSTSCLLASLTLVAPGGVSPAVATSDNVKGTVAKCDGIAGHPDDPDRVGPPAPRGKIDLEKAIKLCGAAHAASPDLPRIEYQYGRVLFYSGRTDEGMPHVKAAADAGYRQAQFVYGLFTMNARKNAPSDPCVAESYWQKSALAGRQGARANYVRYALQGAFDACPGLLPKQDWVKIAQAGKSDSKEFYQRTLFETLEYQTSK